MPSDRQARALADIAEYARLAMDFVTGTTPFSLVQDQRTFLAVVRCLEIISEASRRLSAEYKQQHPQIAWREISAAGNVYRHNYQMVDPATVWTTVVNDLPALSDVVTGFPGGGERP